MIGPLADDHLGHQPRTGQTAGNRLGRLAGQHHVLLDERQAALGQLLFAGEFLADMHHHEQRRGPPIELLAGLRRQLDQILQAAQCRLLGFGKIVNDFLTLGLVGNPPSAALVAVLEAARATGGGELAAASSASAWFSNNMPCCGSNFSLLLP